MHRTVCLLLLLTTPAFAGGLGGLGVDAPRAALRGGTLTFAVTGATPNGWVYLGATTATGGAPLCPPSLPACLDLHQPARVLARQRASAAGNATFAVTLPATLSADEVRLEGVDLAGQRSTRGQTIAVLDAGGDEDGDGLSNEDELSTWGTDPLSADTDGDTISDAAELDAGLDPLTAWTGALRTLFVSSSDATGRIGWPAGTDGLCQDLADAAGRSGRYVALVSTELQAASQRTDDALYLRPDGAVLAVGAADLFDGDVLVPPCVDELGGTRVERVYTGANATGGIQTNRHCENWGAAFGGLAFVGDSGQSASTWISAINDLDCDTPRPYYCVEVADSDGDRLSDADEAVRGTSPGLSDSDADGRTDGEEVYDDGTDPLSP